MIGLRASLSRPGHIRGKALEATSVTIMGQELAIPAGEFDAEYRGPRITTLANAFDGNTSIAELELDLDTSECLNMVYLLRNCTKLVSLDISKLDFSKCKHLDYAFYNTNVASIFGLENLNYPEDCSISWMVGRCYGIKSIDTRKWNKTKNIVGTFYLCIGLNECPDLSFIKWDEVVGLSWLLTSHYYGGVLDLDKYVTVECKPRQISELINNCYFEQINLTKFNFVDTTGGTMSAFSNVPKLKRIKGGLRNLKAPLAIKHCALTHDALIELFDSLYDLAAAGMASQSITLPDAQKALLSDAEIASLTTKGWTLA